MIARFHAPALDAALRQFPVLVLTGARQVGKTTLARWLLPRADYVTLDDPAVASQARLTPAQFLGDRPGPAILDEIQYAPEIFRHLKIGVDRDRRPGRYLVTGSQTFGLAAGVSESLAGRAAVFSLPPLSITEVSTKPSLAETDAFLWRSGYPEIWDRPELDRELWMGSYVATSPTRACCASCWVSGTPRTCRPTLVGARSGRTSSSRSRPSEAVRAGARVRQSVNSRAGCT